MKSYNKMEITCSSPKNIKVNELIEKVKLKGSFFYSQEFIIVNDTGHDLFFIDDQDLPLSIYLPEGWTGKLICTGYHFGLRAIPTELDELIIRWKHAMETYPYSVELDIY